MRRFIYFLAPALLGFILLTSSPASADYSVTPEEIWDVKDKTDRVMHTGAIRALIWDLHELDGKMYAGGTFTRLLSPEGQEFDQSFLAAFDLDTGEWISSFRPELDNAVYTITSTPDGRLLVGGEMTGGIVAIDPTTGATLPGFDTNITNSWGTPAVFDIELVGNQLYAGGTFANAQGVALTSLARFSAVDGSIDESWIPSLQKYEGPNYQGNGVHGIAVDVNRERVYIAGKFGSVDNVGGLDAALTDNRSDFFATLDPQTARLKEGVTQGYPVNVASYERSSNRLWDVQTDGNRVYVGGKTHQTAVLLADDLEPIEGYYSQQIPEFDVGKGGDNQAIEIGSKYVWASCHCWGSVTRLPLGVYTPLGERMNIDQYRTMLADFQVGAVGEPQRVKGVYGFNKSTGKLLPLEFDLRGQGGGWALKEDSNGRLWVGGQFTQGGSRALYGLARFSPESATGPSVEACSVQFNNSTVKVSWDAQDEAERFIIRRTVNGSTPYWRGAVDGQTFTFTDINRDAELEYFVEARNGNVSGTPVKCTEDIDAPPPTPIEAPNSCTFVVIGDGIEVTWEASEQAVRYVIYRTVDGSQAYWRGSTDSLSFIDSYRDASLEYFVVAVGEDETRSPQQPCSNNDVPDNNEVTPVDSCSVSQVGADVTVNWQEAAPGAEYVVSRSVDAGTVWWRGKTDQLSFSDTTREGAIEYSVQTLLDNVKSEPTICTPLING